MKNRAFTLIELLVVVLIMGILAAVALPQYQKAVMRTRYNNLKSLVRSIANAQEVYYMANNTYSVDFEELDIQMPGGKLDTSGARQYSYDWGWCTLHNTEKISAVSCTNSLIQMSYTVRLLRSAVNPGKALCMAISSSDENTLQAQICKAETGRTSASIVSTDEADPFTSYWY